MKQGGLSSPVGVGEAEVQSPGNNPRWPSPADKVPEGSNQEWKGKVEKERTRETDIKETNLVTIPPNILRKEDEKSKKTPDGGMAVAKEDKSSQHGGKVWGNKQKREMQRDRNKWWCPWKAGQTKSQLHRRRPGPEPEQWLSLMDMTSCWDGHMKVSGKYRRM